MHKNPLKQNWFIECNQIINMPNIKMHKTKQTMLYLQPRRAKHLWQEVFKGISILQGDSALLGVANVDNYSTEQIQS